ncbi:MAG: metallophosphoesterase [Nanoarchaeota archaeon]|nr:metallophosphoesterase [Nanoarchaeota archaeon]
MVKILVIGDPHGNLKKIKKIPIKNIDLILIVGDLGSVNLARKFAFENIKREQEGLLEKEISNKKKKEIYLEIYNSTFKVINYLRKFAPIYTIFGNVESHDVEIKELSEEIGFKLPFLVTDLKKSGVKIINNRIANFEGIRIGGLEYFIDVSWIKNFKPKDYALNLMYAKRQSAKAQQVLKWFGKYNLDILLCHQPPYGILDKVSKKYNPPKNWIGKNAGSKIILNYIKKKKIKYVFCGHIHEGEGMKKLKQTEIYNLGTAGYKIINL